MDATIYLNRGSSCRSLFKGMVIGQLVSACQMGSSSGDPVGCEEADVPTVISFISVYVQSTFALFAFSMWLDGLHPRFPIVCVGPCFML